MRDHLRFGAAYWHVMRNGLADPFGGPTALMPWDDQVQLIENALKRADVFFEFLDKIGIDFYCFHDRDVAPELKRPRQVQRGARRDRQAEGSSRRSHGVKLLWGTACLFSHPRYSRVPPPRPNADVSPTPPPR
jgi:xylose isomerase